MSVDVKYRTEATATGGGRNGSASLASGMLTMTMATPKELGGSGKGHNPEELFALGYAACFLGAMRAAASMQKLGTVPDNATVTADVGIGPRGDGGFGIAVELKIALPGVEPELAQKMVDAGHFVCPYSHATKGNIDVTLTLV
ncbi:organic hydroperoxide resistance protein [Pararhodobacter aggregans]|uniref:Organic hydroperoxide resistance protein n=1 Tax=Pararhodobacter aggregans TaxID=404875 RepID=A0A2T7UQF1_9RHOB|nr:organic hydroperoxide resistance protein [Pararhodobacter aggregans]PTX01555.1 Ohr subfamily peroxiredoxin [Pararhodobacter aggregans]PVE46821.1 organic hydroperoxide resistance protein [Pararhodobacter aggregans]